MYLYVGHIDKKMECNFSYCIENQVSAIPVLWKLAGVFTGNQLYWMIWQTEGRLHCLCWWVWMWMTLEKSIHFCEKLSGTWNTPALGYLFHWCASRKYLFLHFTFPNIPAANNNNPMGFLYEQGDSWNSLPANSLKTLQYLGKSCLRWWT